MEKQDIIAALDQEPFVPLRLRLVDGRRLDVPYRHVAIVQKQHLLVFKGVKSPTSQRATGYEALGFHLIEGIERRRSASGRRRRKAS
jgi:hypothetical protein